MKSLTVFILTLVLIAAMAVTTATAQEPIEEDPALLAEQVLEKYGATLRRQDIQDMLPAVLEGFKAPFAQESLELAGFEIVFDAGNLWAILLHVDQRFVKQLITLLETDAETQALFSDVQMQALIQNPVAIDEFVSALDRAGPIIPIPDIPDVNLANLLRIAQGRLGEKAPTTIAELRKRRGLDLQNTGIADLTGLEHAVNLEVLWIGYTAVSDISPLANLTKLKDLKLNNTNVSDISPLANLTKLKELNLSGTQVSDISPLANLTNLEELWLYDSPLSAASVQTHIPALRKKGIRVVWFEGVTINGRFYDINSTELRLRGTQFSDISPLANFTNLESLDLSYTAVSDISPLANLTNLEKLELYDTAVSDISPLANLPNLEKLYLGHTNVSDISPLANLTNLEKLSLDGTNVSDISPLANLPKLKRLSLEDTLLRADSHTHFFAMRKKGVYIDSLFYVDVDGDLAKEIREHIGTAEGEPISWVDLDRVRGLYFGSDDNVSDISALGYCPGLVDLDLRSSNVSDISALANLTNLEWLDLGNTNVSDISALANLTKLKVLGLQGDIETGSKVSNFSALAKLTKLENLDLSFTSISDISALEKFTNLEALSLSFTNVRDISPLANLRNLEELDLLGTQLSAESYGHIRAMEEAGITVDAEPSPVRTIDGLWIAPGNDLPNKSGNRFIILTQYGNNCGPTSLEMVLHYYARIRTIEAIRDAGDIHEVWLGTWPSEMRQALDELGVPAHLYDEDTENFSDDPFGYLRYFVRENQPSCILIRYRTSEGKIRYHWVVVVGYNTETNKYLVADPAADNKGGAFRWVSHHKLDKWWGFKSLGNGDVSYWDDDKFHPVQGGFDPFGFAVNFTADPYTVIRPTNAPTKRVKNLRTEHGVNGVTGDGNGPKGFHRVKGKVKFGFERDWSKTIYFDKPFDFYTVSAIRVEWAKLNFGGTAKLTGHRQVGNAVEIWGRVSDGLVVRGVLDVLVRPYYDVDVVRAKSLAASPAQLVLPAETSLLPNYPNPFNPETWIPYHLAEPAEVTLTLYTADGKVVRTLALGHQPAGFYQSRSRAAYWDGRNEVGERVASGVYFYTLTAGEFSVTRKMVIRK